MANDVSFGLFKELKETLTQQGILFLEVGRILKTIRDNDYYKQMGHETFTSFLSDPELALKYSTAYAYIYIFEVFIQKYGFARTEIASIPWYKLRLVAPRLKDATKEQAMELYAKAKTLSIGDLGKELKGQTAFEELKPYPSVVRCETCKNWKVTISEPVCICV